MNSLQSPTLRLHGSNAPPHSWTRSPVQCRYENHVIVCGIRHALHHAASRNDDPFQREGCHLRRRGERNRIRHHQLPAAALLAVWKVSHAMNPTKSAAPIPKVHRVALVDNDPRALESLSLLIEAKVPTAYVVWTATSGDEAIERCQRNDDNLNLLVLDMSMEGLQGPAICHRIRLMDRHLPILGITSFSINSYRSRLMEAGAQGLIGKEDSDQLAKAIERLCGGNVMEGFEPPALANVRIRREEETSPRLTVREEQIISLCADGMLDREIAEQLDISESTVRKHMQGILKKLNCKTARQAVALWVRSHAR